jgi:uncharacterized protein
MVIPPEPSLAHEAPAFRSGWTVHALPPGSARQRALAVAAACGITLLPAFAVASLQSWLPAAIRTAAIARLAAGAPAVAALFFVGAIGGLLSGLLGVGGAVVLLPLLTTFAGMSLKQASNVTIVQVVAAALVSVRLHYPQRLIHVRLAIVMGSASLAGGLIGGLGSAALPPLTVEALFLLVVFVALALLTLPTDQFFTTTDGFPRVPPIRAAAIGLMAGALAGILGAGGGFLIVPLLIGPLHLPTRLAVGTSPAVILIGSIAAMIGKALSRQILVVPAAILVTGAIPFTYLGARLSARLSPRSLRLLLAAVLLVIALRGAFTLYRDVNATGVV